MNFIRRQQQKLAVRYLQWRYQKLGLSEPPLPDLEKRAAQIVDDAHRIAKERGRNVLLIIKNLANEFKDK